MIKNIIFDVGNVLVHFDWMEYLHKLFKDETTIEVVHAAIWKSGLWNELNRNVIPEEQIFERMRDYDSKYTKDIVKALTNLDKCVCPVSYAVPWLKNLRNEGKALYYLSNYSPLLLRSSKEALEFILHTDGGVMSCDINLIKPDRAIYSALCHIYKLDPKECLFIDDRQENVQAAIDYGMQGLLFTDYPSTSQELTKLL